MRTFSPRLFIAAGLSLALLLPFTSVARAGGSTLDLQDTIGSGPNTSYMVLDFGTPSSPDAFAFAYDWSGSQTDGSLIDALAAANVGFSDTSTTFTFGGTSERQFDSFTLGANTFSDVTDPLGYWNLWTSPDGTNWTSAIVGADETPLTDGSWEGWTWVPDFFTDNAEPPTTPFLSDATTPEPGTMALVGLGAGAFVLVRRKIRRRTGAATA
jgi:hypothetical protein